MSPDTSSSNEVACMAMADGVSCSNSTMAVMSEFRLATRAGSVKKAGVSMSKRDRPTAASFRCSRDAICKRA